MSCLRGIAAAISSADKEIAPLAAVKDKTKKNEIRERQITPALDALAEQQVTRLLHLLCINIDPSSVDNQGRLQSTEVTITRPILAPRMTLTQLTQTTLRRKEDLDYVDVSFEVSLYGDAFSYL